MPLLWRCSRMFIALTFCIVILLTSCSAPQTTSTSSKNAFSIYNDIYRGHHNAVSAVVWSPDGKRIASASYDKTVQVWDAATGHLFFTYRGHTNWVTAVAWSPDGKRIASVSFDKTVQVWDAVTGKPAWIYCCLGWVNGVAWSPNGKYVASASSNKTVEIWNGVTDHLVLTYRGYRSEVLTVAWSPDGAHIASGDDDGMVRIWQAPS